MGALGQVTSAALRLEAQQRADMVNSQFVSTSEWMSYLSKAHKELFDLLVTSYSSNYYMAVPYVFSTAVSNSLSGQGVLYPLPDGLTTTDLVTGQVAQPFYKLLGLDMQTGAPTNQPTNWVSVDRADFNDRNRYGYLGSAGNTNGVFAIKYSVQGKYLWLTPVPAGNLVMQLWYVPKPFNLLVTLSGDTTITSSVVTTGDTSQLSVGSSVQILGQTITYTVSTIVTNVSFTLTGFSATSTGTNLFQAWNDQQTVDGVSGWEDIIVVSAAIKALAKEESDTSALEREKQALYARIEIAGAERDIGRPSHVSPPTDRYSFGRRLGWD